MSFRLHKLLAKFSIRDLLWLVLLATVFTAWHASRKSWLKEGAEIQHQAVVKTRELDSERDELKDQGEGVRRETSQLQAKLDAMLQEGSNGIAVRDEEVRLQTQSKLADMVERFNKLMDEKRYAEAGIIAQQARDIAPDESVVVQMVEKSKLAMRIYESRERRDYSLNYDSPYHPGIYDEEITPGTYFLKPDTVVSKFPADDALNFGSAAQWRRRDRSPPTLP